MLNENYSWSEYLKEEMDFVNPKLKLFGFEDLILINLDAVEKAEQSCRKSINTTIRQLTKKPGISNEEPCPI